MGVGSRYDKYGEIVHRMSGLVPSVIAERDDVSIRTSSNFFNSIHIFPHST